MPLAKVKKTRPDVGVTALNVIHMSQKHSLPIAENVATIDGSGRFSELIGRLLDARHELVVFQGARYDGFATVRDLSRKGRIEYDTRISKLHKIVKPIDPNSSTKDIAQAVLFSRTQVLPLDLGQGEVEFMDVAEFVKQNCVNPDMEVSEIMTKEVITRGPKMKAVDGIRALRSNNISRIPLVDERGEYAGTVRDRDFLLLLHPTVVGDRFKKFTSKISGSHALETEMHNFASHTYPAVFDNTSIAMAITAMQEAEEDGVIVLKDNKPVGVLTMVDLLEAIAAPETEPGYQIRVIGDVDEIDLPEIVKDASETIAKISDFIGENGYLYAHIKAFPRNKFRGLVLYQVRIRVGTDKGYLFAAKGEAHGVRHAANVALDHLWGSIVSEKEIRQKRSADMNEYDAFTF